MPILCPNCNKNPLYFIIKQEIAFTISSIGFADAIPDERVSSRGQKLLQCLACKWHGDVADYHQVKNGVIKLFPGEPKYEDLD